MLLAFSSGVFSQSCDLTINDEDNIDGAYYNLVVELWNCLSIPYIQLNTEYKQNVYFLYSGYTVPVPLDYQVGPDYAKLKFHIKATNTSTSRYGWGWSQQTFDSYDYYNNSPPVTVNI